MEVNEQGDFVVVLENLMGKFIKWILVLIANFYSFIYDFKAVGTWNVCLFVMILFEF